MPLLRVRNLVVGATGPREAALLDDISFDLSAAETLGLVGESGSGKSTLARAILGLLPPELSIWAGSVEFHSRDLARATARELRAVRGAQIAYVAQDPALALNPVLTIGFQIGEVLRAHETLTHGERRKRAMELLDEVGFQDVERILASRPHELSGGERQRVAIAQAISCRPSVMVADEPTTALDTTTRGEILELLGALRDQHGLSLLLISHDMGMVTALAERVVVLYAGEVAEEASGREMLQNPQHPYSQALSRCLERDAGGRRFVTIPGMPPRLPISRSGCAFEPRCAQRLTRCSAEHPPEFQLQPSSRARCWLHDN